MTNAVTMLEAALQYAALGYHVFPVRARQKKPPLTEHGHMDATTDPEMVKAWWTEHPDANVALACARSKIVVIDVDVPSDFHKLEVSGEVTLAAEVAKLGKLPETPEAMTGGNGRHLFFITPPDVQFRSEIGPGLEIVPPGRRAPIALRMKDMRRTVDDLRAHVATHASQLERP